MEEHPDQTEPTPDKTVVAPWRSVIVQVVGIVALTALGYWDLQTPDESVPWVLYGTIAGVVGGIGVVGLAKLYDRR